MAFLDNSGDIILDAVLTDTGRMRMAKGDGSFRISKFALADDEIDYELFDGSASTAYQDLSIMQTPILEAFTNNTSGNKYKLFSLANNPGLYLPVLRPVEIGSSKSTNNLYDMLVVAVDEITQGTAGTTSPGDAPIAIALGGTSDNNKGKSVISGFSADENSSFIRIDQGIDTNQLSQTSNISAELYESQYLIEMDSRFATLYSKGTDAMAAAISFIDDDSIASYYLSQAVNGKFVVTNPEAGKESTQSSIEGPRGSRLYFTLRAQAALTTSTGLFTKLGSILTDVNGSGNDYYYIDSNIRITGVTTGSTIDIPVRFVKYKTT